MPVTVDLNPSAPVVEPAGGTAGDDVAARRAALFRRFDESDRGAAGGGGAAGIDLERATAAPTAPREHVESVVVQTPVGEIEFGPPSGVSLTMRIAVMMGEANPNRLQSSVLRVLMSVRSVDGQRVTPINTMVEAQYLANQLGDSVLDYLFGLTAEYWPPPGPSDLQVIRKSKRVT